MIDVCPCMPYTIHFKDYPLIIARYEAYIYVILHDNIFKAGRTIYPRGTFTVLYESTKIDFDNFERELDYFKDKVFRLYPGYVDTCVPDFNYTIYSDIRINTEYTRSYEEALRMYAARCREDMFTSGGTYV